MRFKTGPIRWIGRTYQYVGATEETPDGGFISEVIPIVCETKKYVQTVIPQLKKMKELIDTL